MALPNDSLKLPIQNEKIRPVVPLLGIHKMTNENQKGSLLKKGGKWATILGATWIVLNIALPLALLRIPAVQKYLTAFKDKLPFDIGGIG